MPHDGRKVYRKHLTLHQGGKSQLDVLNKMVAERMNQARARRRMRTPEAIQKVIEGVQVPASYMGKRVLDMRAAKYTVEDVLYVAQAIPDWAALLFDAEGDGQASSGHPHSQRDEAA